jgi:WD40 repeat protein/tRNA A-37 threonylcarbamoyl transferase component Bud32
MRLFGEYELLEVIARGGMGVVYRARQRKLQRIVALKMILTGDMASQQELERFQLEAEAAAQLDHPGIVPIFEVGEHDGQHFFSMGYVEGGSLARRIREGPLPPRDSAVLVSRIAEAVHYAHGKGIIHRDLKPGNVLLDKEGHPKVSDFGLAKRVADASQLTTAGQVLGTPSYMPPEQAAGKIEEVRASADIYALGAILYCLLTGRPPFHAASGVETLKQVLEREPLSPRQLNSHIDRDLETICLKCLQKEPAKRYASALALADDLRRYLAGMPILARPVGRVERLWRWCKRNPMTASLTAGIQLAIIAGLAFSLYFAAEASKEADIARDKEKQARLAQLLSDHRRHAAEISLAHREWQDAFLTPMLKRLDSLLPQDAETRDLRSFEWHYLKRLGHLEFDTFRGHTAAVMSVAYSNNGRWLASAAGDDGSKSRPGEVKVWDCATGLVRHCLSTTLGLVETVTFSPDGRLLAAGSRGVNWVGEICVWDLETGQLKWTIKDQLMAVRGLAFSPDGTRLYSGGGTFKADGRPWKGEVKAWDVATGMPTLTLPRDAAVKSLAVSRDGHWLASAETFADTAGSGGAVLQVYDLDKGQTAVSLPQSNAIVSLVFSPDGQYLATGSDQTVKVWSLTAGKPPVVRHTLAHVGSVTSVAFDADSTKLAVGTGDNRVTIWDLVNGRQVRKLQGHTAAVNGVAFSPDGWRLASASADQTVKVWDATLDLEMVSLNTGDGTAAYQVALQPGGHQLAVCSRDQTIRIWDTALGQVVRTLYGHADTIVGVAYSPDGNWLASASEDRTVRLWDASTGKQQARLAGHTDSVNKVVISPTGDRLATCSKDNTVLIWDVASRRPIHTLRHEGPVWAVAFSPDGSRVASASLDKTVRLWDTASGQEILTLRKHTAGVWGVAFSPDGLTLASTGDDRTVRVWDVATGQQKWIREAPVQRMRDVQFSPDGRRLAATGGAQVKFWDTYTGQELFLLRGPQTRSFSIAFSPDGLRVFAACQADGHGSVVVFWDGTPLTPELRDQREAHSLLRLLVPPLPPRGQAVVPVAHDHVVAKVKDGIALRESVRQQTLALVESRLQARLHAEAERAVRDRFKKKLFLRTEVLESLRADSTLRDSVRQEALLVAEALMPSATELNKTSKDTASRPDATPAELDLALRQAEAACESAGPNGDYQTTRGIVLYRLGRCHDAVDALTQADRLLEDKIRPETLAFLAMAQYRDKFQDQARATFQRLEVLLRQPGWAKSLNSAEVVAAKKLLAGN